MSFKDQLLTDLDIFFDGDEFAETATYTPVSGEAVTCSVIVDHDVYIQPETYESSAVEIGTTIDARVDYVGKPRKGSTFRVGATTYTVARVEAYNQHVVRCVVK